MAMSARVQAGALALIDKEQHALATVELTRVEQGNYFVAKRIDDAGFTKLASLRGVSETLLKSRQTVMAAFQPVATHQIPDVSFNVYQKLAMGIADDVTRQEILHKRGPEWTGNTVAGEIFRHNKAQAQANGVVPQRTGSGGGPAKASMKIGKKPIRITGITAADAEEYVWLVINDRKIDRSAANGGFTVTDGPEGVAIQVTLQP